MKGANQMLFLGTLALLGAIAVQLVWSDWMESRLYGDRCPILMMVIGVQH
jgi:hypothetical protein